MGAFRTRSKTQATREDGGNGSLHRSSRASLDRGVGEETEKRRDDLSSGQETVDSQEIKKDMEAGATLQCTHGLMVSEHPEGSEGGLRSGRDEGMGKAECGGTRLYHPSWRGHGASVLSDDPISGLDCQHRGTDHRRGGRPRAGA